MRQKFGLKKEQVENFQIWKRYNFTNIRRRANFKQNRFKHILSLSLSLSLWKIRRRLLKTKIKVKNLVTQKVLLLIHSTPSKTPHSELHELFLKNSEFFSGGEIAAFNYTTIYQVRWVSDKMKVCVEEESRSPSFCFVWGRSGGDRKLRALWKTGRFWHK
jgi:hypothetical protein